MNSDKLTELIDSAISLVLYLPWTIREPEKGHIGWYDVINNSDKEKQCVHSSRTRQTALLGERHSYKC